MGERARSDATPGAGRGVRFAAAGLGATLLLGALVPPWSWQRTSLAEAGTPHMVATELAPLSPRVAGLVPATAAPRAARWRLTAADVLGEPDPSRSRLRVVPAATAQPTAEPEGLVVVLAEGVRGAGPTGGQPVARLAGVDAATGHVRWRGPAFGDVADCARAPGGYVACLERFDRAGLLVALGADDGATRWRADVAGRPAALGADPAGLVSVAATPGDGGTDLVLTRWDADGSPRWSRTDTAPAGATPGRPLVVGGAVVVEQVTVGGAALIVDDRDGSLARSRPDGAAVGMAHGRPLFDAGGERLTAGDRLAVADGGELRGSPVEVVAADGSVVLPILARRFGSEDGRAALTAIPAAATPATAAPGRPWSVPGAHPLAACDGQLVLAVTEGRSHTLRAVDPATGATRWETPLRGTTPRSAACTPRTVLIPGGPTPAAVDEYDLATGAPRHPTARAGTRGDPTTDGSVELLADAGALLALGADSSGAWVARLS